MPEVLECAAMASWLIVHWAGPAEARDPKQLEATSRRGAAWKRGAAAGLRPVPHWPCAGCWRGRCGVPGLVV